VPAVDEPVGNGVFYGSAVTAAREMEGYDAVVVGGGNSAGQAALHLARFARSVTILVRRPHLAETMSRYLVDEISYNPVVTGQGLFLLLGADPRLGERRGGVRRTPRARVAGTRARLALL
jgi:thioredoxin reductase (NADPH)